VNKFWSINARKEWLRRINIIRKDSGWSKSNLFGRCQGCGGFTINGRCVRKGLVTICCECQRVKELDGVYRVTNYPGHRISHRICLECHKKLYPGMLERIAEGKARNV